MDCDAMLELMQAHIDGEASAEEEARLQNHLKGCGRCRKLLADYEQLDTGLAALAEEPPERMAQGVRYRIEHGAETERRKHRGVWIRCAAIAAAVVIILAGSRYLPAIVGQQSGSDTGAAEQEERADAALPEKTAVAADREKTATEAELTQKDAAEFYGAEGTVLRCAEPVLVFYDCDAAALPELAALSPVQTEENVCDLQGLLEQTVGEDAVLQRYCAAETAAKFSVFYFEVDGDTLRALNERYGDQYTITTAHWDDSADAGLFVAVLRS